MVTRKKARLQPKRLNLVNRPDHFVSGAGIKSTLSECLLALGQLPRRSFLLEEDGVAFPHRNDVGAPPVCRNGKSWRSGSSSRLCCCANGRRMAATDMRLVLRYVGTFADVPNYIEISIT